MSCRHTDIMGNVFSDKEGSHYRDYCKQCGAIRTYTHTPDGLVLGGQWTGLQEDCLVVKEEGQLHGKDKPD